MVSQQSPRVLSVEQVGGVTLVKFTKTDILDQETTEAVGEQLFALVEERNPGPVVVNLGKVQRLTSLMVGKLVALHKKVHRAGGRLALCGVNPSLLDVLETLKLARVLNIYRDEQEALQSF
jgi:anti-sigma B factor antagonist